MHDAAFDDFYRATRRDLVLQTFLVTGDLTAATYGTREAYVAAARQWRKVGALADPAGWVRPIAHRLAQRRSAGRVWHRTSSLPEPSRSQVTALSTVSVTDRRLVVLVHVGAVPLEAAARELSLTREAAARRLDSAASAVAADLEVPVAELGRVLMQARELTDPVVLPRTSLVLRQGRRRRQLVGAALVTGTVAVTLGAGALALLPSETEPDPGPPPAPLPPELVLSDTLLTTEQVSITAPRVRWREGSTTDNTTGSGFNMVCQRERFADPGGVTALVRTFEVRRRPVSAVQTTEVSASPREARDAMRTVATWFGQCAEDRVQLVAAHRVRGAGDEAMLLELHTPDQKSPWQVVGLGRTGTISTTLVVRAGSRDTVQLAGVRNALARGLQSLCEFQDEEADCATRPRHRPAPPPPGNVSGMLNVVDLPPLRGITRPWIGTEPDRARRENPAATTCDNTSFRPADRARARTFVIPKAKLPLRFGLDEVQGSFANDRAARQFVGALVRRVDTCPDRDVTADVTTTLRRPGAVAWSLETEVAENAAVRYRTGVVRIGRHVAQVTFVPVDRADLSDAQMTALMSRAAQRLRELD